MTQTIVVIGSLNLDLVTRVARLPRPGETVQSSKMEQYAGGKGANQAVAAARLGAQVRMIGSIGKDSAAEMLKRALLEDGVDLSGVRICAKPTGCALITTDETGENTIVIAAEANDQLLPEHIDRAGDIIGDAAIVLMQLEVPLETVERAAALCHQRNIPLILDPAPGRQLSPALLRQTTWLTPNETECAIVLGIPKINLLSVEERADRLLSLGCRNVALKLGSNGVFLVGRDTAPAHIPAFPANAVDTTAAGDVFNGAFAHRLVTGDTPAQSARYAAAAASICVTRYGAQKSMPTSAEVAALL